MRGVIEKIRACGGASARAWLRWIKTDLTDVFGFRENTTRCCDFERVTTLGGAPATVSVTSIIYIHYLSDWTIRAATPLIWWRLERRAIKSTIYIEISQNVISTAVVWMPNSVLLSCLGGRFKLLTEKKDDELFKMANSLSLLVFDSFTSPSVAAPISNNLTQINNQTLAP